MNEPTKRKITKTIEQSKAHWHKMSSASGLTEITETEDKKKFRG